MLTLYLRRMLVVCLGFVLLLALDPKKYPGGCFFAVFLCVGGVAPCISNTISWAG